MFFLLSDLYRSNERVRTRDTKNRAYVYKSCTWETANMFRSFKHGSVDKSNNNTQTFFSSLQRWYCMCCLIGFLLKELLLFGMCVRMFNDCRLKLISIKVASTHAHAHTNTIEIILKPYRIRAQWTSIPTHIYMYRDEYNIFLIWNSWPGCRFYVFLLSECTCTYICYL